MEIKLYVGNLSFTTTEDAICTLFAQAGTVTSVEVIKDRFTGNSKGFAFVQMSSQQEAEKAITMFNGYSLDNREIKVNPARPREDSGAEVLETGVMIATVAAEADLVVVGVDATGAGAAGVDNGAISP